MSTLAIFVLGFLVITITLTAAALIGLSEAGDPAHSRFSDLSVLERALVDREQDEKPEPTGQSPEGPSP